MTRAVNPAPTKKLATREKNAEILPGGALLVLLDDADFTASSAKVLLNCTKIGNKNTKRNNAKPIMRSTWRKRLGKQLFVDELFLSYPWSESILDYSSTRWRKHFLKVLAKSRTFGDEEVGYSMIVQCSFMIFQRMHDVSNIINSRQVACIDFLCYSHCWKILLSCDVMREEFPEILRLWVGPMLRIYSR